MIILEDEPVLSVSCYPQQLDLSNGGERAEGVKINNQLQLQFLFKQPVDSDTLTITCPWGAGEQDFTNAQWAASMHVSAYGGWSVNEIENEIFGRYWVMQPKQQGCRQARLHMTDINLLCSGLTCINVYHKQKDKENLYRIPLRKEAQALRIEKFQAAEMTVTKEEGVSLSWTVTGADYCVLDPGNMAVLPKGDKVVYTDQVTHFTLRAFRGEQCISSRLKIFYRQPEKET